jgi:hypothetical protein
MAFFTIDPPAGGSLSWDAIYPLEGVEYLLRFYWSTRNSKWYMSIFNQNNDPLALWMALNVNVAPLRRFRAQTNIPPGVFIVVDTTLQGKEILAPEDFGARVILAYVTSDDPLIAGVSLIGRA